LTAVRDAQAGLCTDLTTRSPIAHSQPDRTSMMCVLLTAREATYVPLPKTRAPRLFLQRTHCKREPTRPHVTLSRRAPHTANQSQTAENPLAQ
jgi:hypothetical protein